MKADPMTPAALCARLVRLARAEPGPPVYAYSERDRMMLAVVLDYLVSTGDADAVSVFVEATNFGGRAPMGTLQ